MHNHNLRSKRGRKEVITIDDLADTESNDDVCFIGESSLEAPILLDDDDEISVKPTKKAKQKYQKPSTLSPPTKKQKIEAAVTVPRDEIDELIDPRPPASPTNKCRFCEIEFVQKRRGKNIPTDVCNKDECWKKYRSFCSKSHKCGHSCLGIKNELECMECIHPQCAAGEQQTSTDPCNICYENLGTEPCLKLHSCGHIFHFNCLEQWIQQGYDDPKIQFNNLNCPLCNKQMQHDELTEAMWTGLKLKRDVAQLCKIGLDWIDLEEEVKNPQGAFYQDKLGWALKNLNFYCCYECDKPYCGGARVCGEAGEREAFNKKDLVCGACSNVRLRLKNGVCSKHGSDYVSFKCRYCCSVAVWFCFGTTHFCDKCHSMHNQMATSKNLPVCPGGSLCPIGGNHPPNGQEYALGCGLCCKH